MNRLLPFLAGLFLLATMGFSQTPRYVDGATGTDAGDCSNETSPCETISYAIGQATAGDAIEIADGVYTESLAINQSLNLHGESEAGTILQAHENPGEATSRVITIDGDYEVEMSGLTVRHGVASGNAPNLRGGGVYGNGATIILTNVTIRDNTGVDGGGISTNGGSSTLTNVTIENNAAQFGGGMLTFGGSHALENVLVRSNTATNTGGGMYTNFSSPTFTDVAFIENTAGGNGGGLYLWAASSTTAMNLTFRENVAGGDGGGIYKTSQQLFTLTNAIFIGNSAGNDGGGMSSMLGSSTLTNVTFGGNSAGRSGGGVTNRGQITLLNSIVWDNTAEGAGNEIYNRTTVGDHSFTLLYSLYNDGRPEDVEEGWNFTAESCLNENPLFVDVSNGNLRLQDISPAIDAGHPSTDSSGFPTDENDDPVDLSGNPRFFGAGIDMGTYEWNPTVADEASPREIAEVLSHPRPNPVRGSTLLTLRVAEAQDVVVEVFDATGRRVQTLYDGALPAGMSETLTLHASTLPAGVYVIRATGEDFAETRRVTVIR